MSEWISVDERLPEETITVVVSVEGSPIPVVAFFMDGEWLPDDTHLSWNGPGGFLRGIDDVVTAWKPLPEPPTK